MPLLCMKEIDKVFGGVHAVRNVSLQVQAGKVHALIGENGAGKSTLMKILAGVVTPDRGAIEFDGKTLSPAGYRERVDAGITMIFQDTNLFENLTVAENLLFDDLPRSSLGLLSYRRAYGEARELLRGLDFDVAVHAKVAELTIGQRQIVEVAKAISKGGKLVIMDEPTASLDSDESERLFVLVRKLAADGVSVIYISHRLDEVFRISDRVSVLRDGQMVGEHATQDTDPQTIIREMVGRDVQLGSLKSANERTVAAPVLEVQRLCVPRRLTETNFSLRPGGILGVAGLRGVGQQALVEVLQGLEQNYSGTIRIFAGAREIDNPRDAIALGIAYVTDDRKGKGLLMNKNSTYNGTLSCLHKISSFGFLRAGLEAEIGGKQTASFGISSHAAAVPVKSLSGGNQQKVLLARALEQQPRILILNEPTAGIDIGAKEEIYRLLLQLSANGMATLLISSDLEELQALSDEILVLNQKRPAVLIPRELASEETIMEAAVT